MTDKQENKLSMNRATEKVLDDNNSLWSADPLFSTAKTAFSGKIVLQHDARQRQSNIITGIAVDKSVLKEIMIFKTLSVGSKTSMFADDTNNNELLNEVNITRTQLENARDEDIAGICQNVHDRANANIVALAAYNILPATLTDFQTSINVYDAKVPEPRAAKAAKKAVTLQIVSLFKDTDKILKTRLDKLMEDFKTSEPEFYNAYKTAREIIDLGATHTKFSIFVKNEDGIGIQSVLVSLLQGSEVKYSGTTGLDGRFKFPKVSPATYDLKVQKETFISKTEAGILFKAGKEIKRTVTLQGAAANVVVQGSVPTGVGVHNIQLGTFNPSPSSMVIIEITEEELDFYAAPAPNIPPAGSVYTPPVGTTTLPLEEFVTLVGFSDTNTKLNVMNNGAVTGHYKITFTNLLP